MPVLERTLAGLPAGIRNRDVRDQYSLFHGCSESQTDSFVVSDAGSAFFVVGQTIKLKEGHRSLRRDDGVMVSKPIEDM
jgi:hypothetical protein